MCGRRAYILNWPSVVWALHQSCDSPMKRAIALLLSCHALLLAWGAYTHSPTFNEPGHLVAGISNWQLGRFDVYMVNPPLVRLVAAAPVVLVGTETDWRGLFEGVGARPEFPLGEDFVRANGERSFWLFTLARWACIPFSLLGACVSFCWARDLYGRTAGLMALTLWCFCPNIIANGQLITSDIAATSLALTACYAFWCWLKQPTWRNVVVGGLTLGLAELAKTTLLVFYVIWPIMWLIYRWPERRILSKQDWMREACMLVIRTLIGLYVINVGYGFEGSGTRLGEFRFASAALGANAVAGAVPPDGGNRFANSILADIPIPLPKNYILGIDLQKRDFENGGQPSYLGGEFNSRGWWYFYLYALLFKVPLGTWGLIVLACIVSAREKIGLPLRAEFILLCPAILILIIVSSQAGFSRHVRYVLPAFPFIFVWLSRVTLFLNRSRLVFSGLVAATLAWSIASSMWLFPHSLSYFNELAGGPINGPKYLINSSVDWGQDLLYLKRWLNEHTEVKPLNMAYYGYFDPSHARIAYSNPRLPRRNDDMSGTAQLPAGWYAVSVNFVQGLPGHVYTGDGSGDAVQLNELASFQELKPLAMAGYSIYIYHVTGSPQTNTTLPPKMLSD